ncbi:acyl-CoA synthase [Actinokineospora spheciospongiae]|uniref:Acyl-CoA synthase n=1 Tax=Actinokineospora spheciospongiae TaxID=909613 RepID=W7J6I7_9PSEU|nr:AMP-binding protein [Actinokineospora spheciospongiae]EWC64611.1 acyl-CoA synthase [Actinokineospora spheciospongiae]
MTSTLIPPPALDRPVFTAPEVHPDRIGLPVAGAAPAEPVPADSLGAALAWRAKWRPLSVAHHVVDGRQGETRLTSRDLYRLAGAAAVRLRRAGVGTGDAVALCLDTSVDLLAALYGASLVGAVPFLVEPPLTRARHEGWLSRTAAMVAAATPAAVVCGPALATTAARLGPPVLVAPFGTADIPAPTPVRPEAPALIQFSSGTTGTPKAVVLSHRSVLEASRAIALAAPFLAGDMLGGWLPLHHDMGLIGTVVSPFLHNLASAIMPPLSFVMRPERWLTLLHRFRVTISPAPNFAYRLAAEAIAGLTAVGLDLSAWRVAFNGAELVDHATLRQWQAALGPHGFAATSMRPCYGMAELGLAATFAPAGSLPRVRTVSRSALTTEGALLPPLTPGDAHDLVSCGVEVPGLAVRVVDADGREVGDSVIGRVEVRGTAMMTGYLGEPPLAPGSWLDTGDLGFRDSGELVLTGRAKDLVIVAGRNHHPYPIEQAACEPPRVRPGAAAAVGVPDPVLGTERLVVVVESVVFREPAEAAALAFEVERVVSERTALRPDRVLVVRPGTLPRTSSGKMRRGLVASMVASGELA